MTEKQLDTLEMSAWSNDNYKGFRKNLKKFNVKIGKVAVVDELIRGRFKPSYKRLEVLDGKKFIGCIFAPMSFEK